MQKNSLDVVANAVYNYDGMNKSQSLETIVEAFVSVTNTLTQAKKRDLCLLAGLLGLLDH
jgi:hypothetical protein